MRHRLKSYEITKSPAKRIENQGKPNVHYERGGIATLEVTVSKAEGLEGKEINKGGGS